MFLNKEVFMKSNKNIIIRTQAVSDFVFVGVFGVSSLVLSASRSPEVAGSTHRMLRTAGGGSPALTK